MTPNVDKNPLDLARRRREKLRRQVAAERALLWHEIESLEAEVTKLDRHRILSGRSLGGSIGKGIRLEAEIVAASVSSPSRIRGVYFLVSGNRVIYVGQSGDVLDRVHQHKRNGRNFEGFCYIEVDGDKTSLDVLESFYIHALKPPLNRTAPVPINRIMAATI